MGPGKDKNMDRGGTILHASCVAVDGCAVLIRGASGQGKSGLALQLMALGAELVADDRTRVWPEGAAVMADVPMSIHGKIEARGVGILAARPAGPCKVTLLVDMDRPETERLPPERQEDLLGVSLPVIRKSEFPHFPAAILLYLKNRRLA